MKRITKPNRLKDFPVVSFTAKLKPDALKYLKFMQKSNKGSEFICQAIESYYFQLTNPKQYWKQIIEMNYGTIKHLLRQIGRENADKL